MSREIFQPGLRGIVQDKEHIPSDKRPTIHDTIEVVKDFGLGMPEDRIDEFRVMVRFSNGLILNVKREAVLLFRGQVLKEVPEEEREMFPNADPKLYKADNLWDYSALPEMEPSEKKAARQALVPEASMNPNRAIELMALELLGLSSDTPREEYHRIFGTVLGERALEISKDFWLT